MNKISLNRLGIGFKDKIKDQSLIEKIKIKVSCDSLKQKFQICEVNYIKNVCRGRCCQGTGKIMVTVHDTEKEYYKNLGVIIVNNFIQPDKTTGLCPFKNLNGLCNIHLNKPFGCKVSPFTLNSNGTLIIRNRYRLLKCYNTQLSVPAYKAHGRSLKQIFGNKITAKIIDSVKQNDKFYYVEINFSIYKILLENDMVKHENRK